MPRTWNKRTDRGSKNINLYEQAYAEIQNGSSVRSAAKKYKLCHVSLIRYKRKKDNAMENEVVSMGYNPGSKIFNKEQEAIIASYLTETADIYYYGLSPKKVRRMAYDLAVEYNLKRPQSWDRDKCAGVDWFSSFMQRNPELSVRCAQTSRKDSKVKKTKVIPDNSEAADENIPIDEDPINISYSCSPEVFHLYLYCMATVLMYVLT